MAAIRREQEEEWAAAVAAAEGAAAAAERELEVTRAAMAGKESECANLQAGAYTRPRLSST